MTQLNDFKALAEICRGLALSTRERDTLAMFVEMAAEYEGMAAARAAAEAPQEAARRAA